MIIGIGIGVTVALATIAVRVSRQRADFRHERSTVIRAPARAAFELVNDLHQWAQWSPYSKLDPNMQVHYAGPEAGVGAVYEWSGNNKAGQGRMTIRHSEPHRRIELELQFTRPMAATNVCEFKFDPAPEGVRVTWSMHGTNSLVARTFAAFVDVDKMIGRDFSEGLENLKKLAETTGPTLSA